MKHVELNNEVSKIGADGFFQLEKDKEAIQAFILEEIEPKTKRFSSLTERIEYMIENNYYYPELLEQYSMEQIEELHRILYSYQFEFQSYMAISKLL